MDKKSILFVCLGNICRSPMAEGVFNKIVLENGVEQQFEIDSAGLISVHQGELPDYRMRQHASRRGYQLTHRSRPVCKADFDKFDLIIAMDEENIAGLKRLAQTKDHLAKIHRMIDFSSKFAPTHIPDPYYGGDKGFEHVIDLLEDACMGLFGKL
jgi:protein-tyrosine phosphatase